MPDTVKIFGGRAEAVAIEPVGGGPAVVVHGVSFAEPQAPSSLLPKFRPPVDDAVNIGLLHTSLGGAPGHDVYAPVQRDGTARGGLLLLGARPHPQAIGRGCERARS